MPLHIQQLCKLEGSCNDTVSENSFYVSFMYINMKCMSMSRFVIFSVNPQSCLKYLPLSQQLTMLLQRLIWFFKNSSIICNIFVTPTTSKNNMCLVVIISNIPYWISSMCVSHSHCLRASKAEAIRLDAFKMHLRSIWSLRSHDVHHM